RPTGSGYWCPASWARAADGCLTRVTTSRLYFFPPPSRLATFTRCCGRGAVRGLTGCGETECALARGWEVVARIGVGYDAIDVPALTRRRVPLMLVGTANSSSVAEHALFLMLTLARRG